MKGNEVMKNRNIILTTILSAFVCFALCQKVQSATDTPDPGPLAVSNTADGQLALASLTTGIYNAAFGTYSLLSLTDGKFCTGVGGATLLLNTADENTAVGAGALLSNSDGPNNTAIGAFALFNNTDINGSFGSDNTAVGDRALFNNTTGFFNTATGSGALEDNDTGGGNTAIGYFALHNITTGGGNIAIGVGAGTNLSTGNDNIYIGNAGAFSESNTTRIGIAKTTQNTFIDGIHGATIDPATALIVGVDGFGKLGTTASSQRFKDDIKPMDKASEAILALKPVTFHYKSDAKATPCFGLIAEEVEKVSPDLVVYDTDGKPYSVRYDQVNAMLLNEFLKEHKAFVDEQRKVREQEATVTMLESKVAKQETTIAQQQTEMRTVMARLNEQAEQIQNVSAQVEMSKPAPKVVANNR